MRYESAVFYAVNDPEDLQNQMNEFFRSHPNIQVVFMKQSASGRLDHHVTVTILYTY